MSRLNTSDRIHAFAFMMLALAAGGAVTLPLLGAAEAKSSPAVDETVRTRALEATVPDRPTMTDEIEHFSSRASARPDEAFSKERLFAAHMLAFRAYGDVSHLDAAGALLTALSDGTYGRDDSAETMSRHGTAVLRSASTLHLAEHDFPGALQTAEELARRSSDDATRFRLFDARWAVGDKKGAAEILEGPLDTLSTGYLSRQARVVDGAGFTEPARDIFRRVLDNVQAYAEAAPVQAWALVELGHFELHSGDPHTAVRRYLDALEVLPGSPAALEGLASVAYGVDRNLEAARDLYRKALSNGAHLDLVPTLADIEEALGNSAEARRLRVAFVDAAFESPRSEAMHRRPLVFVLAESPSTRKEAVRQARLDLRARQDQGAFDALAWALYKSGDVEMAWTLEERALAAGGPPPPILFRAGIIAEAAGEDERARELLLEALEGQVELAPHEVSAAGEMLQRIR